MYLFQCLMNLWTNAGGLFLRKKGTVCNTRFTIPSLIIRAFINNHKQQMLAIVNQRNCVIIGKQVREMDFLKQMSERANQWLLFISLCELFEIICSSSRDVHFFIKNCVSFLLKNNIEWIWEMCIFFFVSFYINEQMTFDMNPIAVWVQSNII